MRLFRDKIAVVTGAASGIGRAMALRFAAEGMKIVLADIEVAALRQVQRELVSNGAQALAIVTDVASAESVEALANRTLEAFGAVHILCNNAGVGSPTGPVWERTLADWKWIFGVNVWGVVHGVRTFVPLMLKQGGEGHILNTASINGLLPSPLLAAYCASKHAVFSISESLFAELAICGSQLKVSVLCPGAVGTRIADAERNRPSDLINPDGLGIGDKDTLPGRRRRTGHLSPSVVADLAFEAIKDERFVVFTDSEHKQLLHTHVENITAETAVRITESRAERLLRMTHSENATVKQNGLFINFK